MIQWFYIHLEQGSIIWGQGLEGVSMPCFVVQIFLHLKWEVVRREYGFSINSKTSFMSSGDKLFLTLKILHFSLKILQPEVFADFCNECSKSYPL